MKPIILILKYYGISVLLIMILAFNQYAFEFKAPFYIPTLISIFILWGLIYSHLKIVSGVYTQKDIAIVFSGIALPSISIFSFSLMSLDSSKFTIPNVAILALLISAISYVFFIGLFAISKNIIESAPLPDDYDA